MARSRLLWVQERNDLAIDCARRAIERKPDCEGGYLVLGQSLFNADRHREAVELASRAVEASGDDYNVFVPYVASAKSLGDEATVGRLHVQWGHALRKQLEWVPEDVRARLFLAGIHIAQHRESEAVEELENALALRSRDPIVQYNAACCYALLGRKAEALTALEKGLLEGTPIYWTERDPDLASLRDDPEYHRVIAEAKARLERPPEG